MPTPKEIFAQLPSGVTADEALRRLAGADMDLAMDPEEHEAWSRWGDRTTDLQRINVNLTEPETGERIFWNTADVLGNRQWLDCGALHAHRLKQFVPELNAGAAEFLHAAESLAQHCAVRIYLSSNEDEADSVVVDWRLDDLGRPVERLSVDDFLAGRWPGRERLPEHGGAIATLMNAARTLRERINGDACPYVLELSIRVFPPARAPAGVLDNEP